MDDDSKVTAKLLVAADGANSFVRNALNITTKIKKFDQTAIVANFLAERTMTPPLCLPIGSAPPQVTIYDLRRGSL